MATAIFKCRVCGKEYEACRSAKRVDGVFRWQDVACSPEHGATYLSLIRESRKQQSDMIANNPDDKKYTFFEQEYLDEVEDDIFDDESENDDEPEIEV